jgi:hypothetical protein
MMFCPVVGSGVGSWAPVVLELASQWNLMSIALVHRGWMLLLTTPCAVLLSVWMGVGSCLWPISLNSSHIGIASRALM